MNWKKWTIIACIALFVAVNFYLIFKKDSEVARSKYINEWRTVTEQDLVLTKEKEGVVVPAEEEYVYFQNGAGDFERFLVSEGEEVHPGTPLFEYSPQNFEAAIQQFEAEITKLENDVDAIEDNIDSLKKLERDLSRKPANDEEETQSNKEAIASTIQAQIYEKEMELSRVEGEIERLEGLISISDDRLESLTINSTISGFVKKINHDLQNPVVTITSTDQQIKGIVEEEELFEIEEGMKVAITSKMDKFDGMIESIAVNPEHDPHVDVKSEYEFVVSFEEITDEFDDGINEDIDEDEIFDEEIPEDPTSKMFTGTHVELKIITNEVEDALTLPKETIRKGTIYVLNGNGKIEKRKIETGLKVNGIYEIIGEVNEGEFVLHNPTNLKNKTAFFTPLELSKIKKKDLQEMRKKDILRYLGRGLLN